MDNRGWWEQQLWEQRRQWPQWQQWQQRQQRQLRWQRQRQRHQLYLFDGPFEPEDL